jgi:hypothetical protein
VDGMYGTTRNPNESTWLIFVQVPPRTAPSGFTD